MITIRLLNDDDIEINEQQASALDFYRKVYEENGIAKKEDVFIDQQFSFVHYYKQTSEKLSDILQEFQGIGLAITESTIIGTKRYVLNTAYNSNGIIEHSNRFAYDENNDFIASEEIDVTTGLPIYRETLKYYFDRNLDPENELFDCTYNEDGTLERIIYNAYSDQDSMWFTVGGIAGESDIETLRLMTGLTESEMDYYLNAML